MDTLAASHRLDQRVLETGRALIYVMAASIPLAFCRETMYIFQIKGLILQFGGMGLMSLLILHLSLGKDVLPLWRSWIFRAILAFLLWEVFKCWNSISPLLSWREMSRIFWLPVVATSCAYFFRSRRQLEMLVSTMVLTAVLANLYMWVLYKDWLFKAFIGKPQPASQASWDFASWPLLGPWLVDLFFPADVRAAVVPALELREKILPFGNYSFFAGKEDAGSFGSKNFLAAYLNMTNLLMLYRAVTLALRSGLPPWRRLLWCTGSVGLVILVGLSLWHIGQLQNRGSWMGLGAGTIGLALYLLSCPTQVSGYRTLRRAGWGLLALIPCGVLGLYLMQPERFTSMFTVMSASNELRVHTWNSYLHAWLYDRELWPSGSASIVNDVWRWLSGCGSYTFRAMYPKYRSPRIFQIEFNQHNTETSHPENEYVAYLGELGLVGLLLYVAMIGSLLWMFLRARRRDDLQMALLRGAVLFSLLAELTHQFVCVGIRYTCVAFPFWLTLGLALVMAGPWAGQSTGAQSPWASRWTAAVWAGLALLVIVQQEEGWLAPIQHFRSQHFYEMGQIHYTGVRELQIKVDQQQAQNMQARETLVRLEREGGPAEQIAHYRNYLNRSEPHLAKMGEAVRQSFDMADMYFIKSGEYDGANFEGVYIGANMNVQFAKMALGTGDLKAADRYFSSALSRYDHITAHMPYFVQARYWQAVCYAGQGDVQALEVRAGKTDAGSKMLDRYTRALEYFEKYRVQDAIMREAVLDQYRVVVTLVRYYESIGDQPRAREWMNRTAKLVCEALQLFETAGYDLFDQEYRFDVLKLLVEYMRFAPSEAHALKALELYDVMLSHQSVAGLLPFVPKTERNVKTTLSFLKTAENVP